MPIWVLLVAIAYFAQAQEAPVPPVQGTREMTVPRSRVCYWVPTKNPLAPYRCASRCPDPLKPQRARHSPDYACVERGYRLFAPTNDPYQPYKQVERCPTGTKPRRADFPQRGDYVCDSENRGGRILRPTNDPYQPYKVVDRCPAGMHPRRTDHPLKGDMACFKNKPWD
jgi:hypothetical protein